MLSDEEYRQTRQWIIETKLAPIYDRSEAEQWLDSPHQQLGGEKPDDLLRRGDDEPVLTIIDQLVTGSYG